MTASAEFLRENPRYPYHNKYSNYKLTILILLLLLLLSLLLGFFDLAEIDASFLEEAREPLYEFIGLIVHVPL